MMCYYTAGNNTYGNEVKETLLRLRKQGMKENAAYILMQRIFPAVSPTLLMRDGICHKEDALSELGIFSTYLRYILRNLNLLISTRKMFLLPVLLYYYLASFFFPPPISVARHFNFKLRQPTGL